MAAEPLHAPAHAGELPELGFSIAGAEAPRDVASPAVRLDLRVTAPDRFDVHCLLLDCQVRIAPRRRPYRDPDELERLTDLFGPRAQWASSMQGILWANVPLFVPRFRVLGDAQLDLPCSYDFEVSAARYLAALADGAIPIEILFSGAVFWSAPDGGRRVTRVPLDREASFELPVAVWRAALDRHFPGAAWLRVSRDRFARLQAYRATEALPSWDAVIDSLLTDRGHRGGNGAGAE